MRIMAVRRSLLWILLIGLALAVLTLILRHDAGSVVGLRNDQFASLAWNLVLLVFLGGAVVTLFRGRLTQALQAALFWITVVVLLAVGYTYRFELREVADRVLAELIPGYASSRGHTVEIARSRAGDFSVRARVNGAQIPMVLDTGASAVVLTQEAAKAAGLPLEVLSYTVQVETANGHTRAAQVTLDRVAVGGIVELAVPALIAQPGQLRANLLGMSFLNRLQGWEVRGDKLVMRAYP
jgi:aspartyl protease family protein